MKDIVFTLIVIASIFLINSCQNNKQIPEEETELNQNCPFIDNSENKDGLIDEFERAVMDECMQNIILDKVVLKENLIGEWALIGHGEGWIISKSQPCSRISITSTELILEYENLYTDTITTHLWELIEFPDRLDLIISPDPINGIFISHFCTDYMFGDATPFDGNMYLYKKLN